MNSIENELREKVAELEARLAQANELLRALRAGAYDVPDALAGQVDSFLLEE